MICRYCRRSSAVTVAVAILGLVQHRWQLFVVSGVFAVGWSGAGLVPATTVITRWYHTRLDTPELLSPECIEAGLRILVELVRDVDARGLRAGARTP